MTSLNVRDKIAFVSGSTRGIGYAIAELLLREGSIVYINGTREEEVKQVVSAFRAKNFRVYKMCGDVSRALFTKQAIADIEKKHGRIDFLINNAGVYNYKSLEEITENDWQYLMDINLKSVFLLTKEAVPLMKKNKFGRIVNISSVAGIAGSKFLAHYNVTKGGLIAFGAGLAKELGEHNITVNTVAPAYISTEHAKELNKVHSIIGNTAVSVVIPLGRYGEPIDVAKVVLFLVSDLANFITGQTIVVNGGASII